MKTAKEIVGKWLADLQKQHEFNVGQVAESAERLGQPNTWHNLSDVEMNLTAARIGEVVRNDTAALCEVLKLDLTDEQVVGQVVDTRDRAVDNLIRAHSSSMGSPGDGWQVSHFIKATAAARVAQSCNWLLKEIAVQSVPDEEDANG